MSAVWDLWSVARMDGAPSLSRYRQALEVASLVDRAVGALDGLDASLARVAATDEGSTPDPTDVFGALDQARLVVTSLAAALDGLAAMRRSALVTYEVTAPPRLPGDLRCLAGELDVLARYCSPEGHPLLGTLHGMPDVGLDQLVREEPLFREGRLHSGGVVRTPAQLREQATRVSTALLESWVAMTGPSPLDRARAVARRARSLGR